MFRARIIPLMSGLTLFACTLFTAAAPTAAPAPTDTAEPRPATPTAAPPTVTAAPAPSEVPPGPCPTGGEYLYFFEDKEDKLQKYDLDGSLVCEWRLEGFHGRMPKIV